MELAYLFVWLIFTVCTVGTALIVAACQWEDWKERGWPVSRTIHRLWRW